MISIAGVEFVLEQRPSGAVLVKAGKPCGRGWIAEKKRCDPAKLQHALKNRRGDLERLANTKREAKGLKPKQKQEFQDISIAELDASDKMLNESNAKFGGPIDLAIAEPPTTFEGVLNTIVPFNKNQQKLVDELKSDLLGLQNLAKDFALEQRDRGHVDWDDFAKQVRLSAMADKAVSDRVDRLNRLYKGKITQDEADTAAILTRTFHALNPRKQIKMPKGTTQRDYLAIVNQLLDGDKKALKKYTVTRPSKKKKK